MPNIKLRDIINDVHGCIGGEETLSLDDIIDMDIGFATREGEIPCLSIYTDEGNTTIWIDVGPDWDE